MDENGYPLEPGGEEMQESAKLLIERALAFIGGLERAPAHGAMDARALEAVLLPPPESPGDLAMLLDRVDDAAHIGVETAGPGHLGWIPGGGLFAAAVGEFYAQILNRYVTLTDIAPGLAALEHSVGQWLCSVCGMPPGAVGILTSGGSLATFSAVVTARDERLSADLGSGTLYTTAHAHRSVAKAAKLAGIGAENVRIVPCTQDLRMDIQGAARQIRGDREMGLVPFMIVGTAGTTDTGVVDPLIGLAELARQEDLWFHVDAAYGGFFGLTERGARRLVGIEQADSVTLDPHKSLFMPYGTGALVVRDPDVVRAAHAVDGHYLQDLDTVNEIPSFAELGPELTRECRGLRVWLPLHLHGVDAFRTVLDEKLDLAARAYERLSAEPLFDVPWPPDLTIVAFAFNGDEEANRELLARVNARGRVFLSSTTVNGRFLLRLCVLSHRTHRDRLDEAIDQLIDGARELASGGRAAVDLP